jgi:hypothetical protein
MYTPEIVIILHILENFRTGGASELIRAGLHYVPSLLGTPVNAM